MAVAALLALVAGVYLYVTESPQPPPALVVSETVFDFDLLAPGEHEFHVPITNPANVPRRIVGVGQG
jgi:hypothetical protein